MDAEVLELEDSEAVKPKFKRLKAVDYSNSETSIKPEKPEKQDKPRAPRKSKKKQIAADKLASALLMAHGTAAYFLKIPEIALNEADCNDLASDLKELLNHYEIVIDEKLEAQLTLLSTVAMIYGSKYIQYRARLKAEKKESEELADAY